MSTRRAILLVASSYFACGFCLHLGTPLTDVNHSQMKTIRDHAERNTFWRRSQQKQFAFVDPSLADFIHLTEVRSSGANETGDVTLEASFLLAANFTWLHISNSQLTCTIGKQGYYSGIRVTTSIDVNVNGFTGLALFLQTKSFSVLLFFDKLKIIQVGVQAATNYFYVFDVPKTIDVDTTGEVTFHVTLPSNHSNIAQNVQIIHSYINADTEEYEYKVSTYEASSISGSHNTRITLIRDGINRTGGVLSLIILDLDDLDTISDTSFSRMLVIKMIDIRDNGVGFTKDIVVFDNITTQSSYHVTGDNYIRYGSVLCLSYGQPKPSVEISKDGQVLETIGLSHSKLSTGVYVPLDGKTKAEALGVYNCTATSGSKSITKQINVVE